MDRGLSVIDCLQFIKAGLQIDDKQSLGSNGKQCIVWRQVAQGD
jgi:hypothetical protein